MVVAVVVGHALHVPGIRERAVAGDTRGPIEEIEHLIVPGAGDVVGADVVEPEGNRVPVVASEVHLAPAVPLVLIDVGAAEREVLPELVLDVERDLVAVRGLEIPIHPNEPGASLRSQESPELGRRRERAVRSRIEDPVSVEIREPIYALGRTDRVLVRTDVRGGVEVEPSVEPLHHGLAFARQVVGETETWPEGREGHDVGLAGRDRREEIALLRREALLGVADAVPVEAQAEVQREAVVDGPGVLRVERDVPNVSSIPSFGVL